jgi:hypothetical protein
VTGLCYFGVSIVGFHAFGTAVPDNVLLAFAHGSHFWVVSAANLMVVVHVAAAYQGEWQQQQQRCQQPRQCTRVSSISRQHRLVATVRAAMQMFQFQANGGVCCQPDGGGARGCIVPGWAATAAAVSAAVDTAYQSKQQQQ